jgi:hypothetical protein
MANLKMKPIRIDKARSRARRKNGLRRSTEPYDLYPDCLKSRHHVELAGRISNLPGNKFRNATTMTTLWNNIREVRCSRIVRLPLQPRRIRLSPTPTTLSHQSSKTQRSPHFPETRHEALSLMGFLPPIERRLIEDPTKVAPEGARRGGPGHETGVVTETADPVTPHQSRNAVISQVLSFFLEVMFHPSRAYGVSGSVRFNRALDQGLSLDDLIPRG